MSKQETSAENPIDYTKDSVNQLVIEKVDFCPNCGNKIDKQSLFCGNCGYKF